MEEVIQIAIIHGDSLVDGKFRDGEIDYIKYLKDEQILHLFLLLDYLQINYLDKKEFDKYRKENGTDLNEGIMINTIVNLGVILFINSTRYRITPNNENGIFFLKNIPSITSTQLKSCIKLCEELKSFENLNYIFTKEDENKNIDEITLMPELFTKIKRFGVK